MKHNYTYLLRGLIAVCMLISCSYTAVAQCGNDNNFAAAVTSIPCGTDGQVAIGAGTYATFPVINGATYVFRTCGSTAITGSTFDTQLTGFNGASNTVSFYNDDNGGTCTNCVSSICSDATSTNRESYAQWTSPFTGTLRVNMDRFNCDACIATDCPALGSALLRYRQVSNLSITSSSADMCSGETRTLAATPAGGSFTGTGVSSGTFTAPSTAGTYTITYTLGSCSSTQTIVVKSNSTAPTSINASSTSLCQGSNNTVTLTVVGGSLGTNAIWRWYSGSCGGTAVGTGSIITVTPPVGTTNYYVRAEGDCNNSGCVSKTIQVKTVSTDPTSINISTNCFAGHVLSVVGGSLGTGATWVWYEGSTCCTTPVGTGQTLLVNPSATTFYYVRAEGDCNNTNNVTAVVNPHNVLTSSATAVDVSCNGGTNGQANLSVSGGFAPYTFAWSNGDTTQNITGVAAGTYSVTVQDDHLCASITSVTINEPAAIVATATAVDASCNGGTTGAVNLTVSGGTAPYTFVWSTTDTAQNLSGLGAGTYTVTVQDANACNTTASATVNEPTAIVATATADSVSCNGGTDGALNLTVNGGTAPYIFVWSTTDTTQNLAGLAAGTYSVIVTDSNSCNITASFIVNEPAVLVATATAVDVSCNGATNGAVNLTVSGGTAPYTFVWNTTDTTQNLTGLAPGTYSVTVTDTNLCSATTSVVVSEPAILVATATAVDASCNGGTNGAVNLTVSGGTAPYTFVWNTINTTQNLAGLAAGTYNVTITDANSCNSTASAVVNEPTALIATVTATDATCNGGTNGAVNLTVSGSTAPYTFVWNTTDTTQNLAGLAAGTYNVTITDANSCNSTATATVNEPTALIATVTATDVVCNGGTNGAVNLTVSGGTAPYTFVWNTTDTTQNLAGLAAGTYNVTITDANSCNSTATVTVNEPTALVATATAVDASCNGATNGAVNLTISGGISPYTFVWNTTDTTQNLAGLAAGTYNVTITDANLCSTTATVVVNQPTVLTATATAVNVSCNGGVNGQVNLTVSGGTASYTYLWSNTQTTQNITGLAVGTYLVTVTDANLCSTTASATISEPTVLIATATAVDVSCNGGINGQVNLTVSGGTASYTYLWSNTQATQNITGLPVGTYSVTVTDANLCSTTASATVSQSAALTAVATAVNITCNGETNGEVNLAVNGGVTPYTYLWSNTATTQNITGLAVGIYSVTVQDANSCSASASATVSEPTALNVSGVVTNNSGGNNGAVDLTVSGGTTAYTYNWSNAATTEDVSGLAAGVYTVTVTDDNACTSTATFTIITVGIQAIDQIVQFNVMPNPASNTVTIQIELNEMTNLNLELVDLTGKVVVFKQLENVQTQNNTTLNLSDIASGVYIVRLNNDKLNVTRRLVIHK